MSTFPHQQKMSVEAYLELDRNSTDARYEYIDGYVRMLAGGTADHSTISLNTAAILRHLLRGSSCRVYTSDLKVYHSGERYFYPDVFVSCDLRDRGQITAARHPCLIVEVLSLATEAFDRGKKFEFYQEIPTIKDYILISSDAFKIEVFKRERENLWSYQSFKLNDQVEIAHLGIRFAVADIYENVLFATNDTDPPA